MRAKKGNLMMVVMYATVMAFVLMGVISLAYTYNSSIKNESKKYANYQTYKSMTEIACYAYIRSLQTQVITFNKDNEWISVDDRVRFSIALEEVHKNLTDTETHTKWKVTDIDNIIASAGIEDENIILDMLGLLKSGKFNIEVIPAEMDIDWGDPQSNYNKNTGHVAIKPMIINVNMKAKGEKLEETFIVDGLFLDMVKDKNKVEYTFGVDQERGDITIERENKEK